MKFGVIFRLNATTILLFTHTEGTRRLRCSCTFGTDGTHKLRCSCTLVPAVHGAPWYRPPARTSGTGTGTPRLPARWYTVRTRTVPCVLWPGSDVWVLSTPESARADAKSATSSSKSATHGRPHDSDDTLGASFSPALTLMLQSQGLGLPGPAVRSLRHDLTCTSH